MGGIVRKIEGRYRWSFWAGGKWWWVMIGRNGEVLSSSEMYTTKEKRDQTAVQVASQLDVAFVSTGERL